MNSGPSAVTFGPLHVTTYGQHSTSMEPLTPVSPITLTTPSIPATPATPAMLITPAHTAAGTRIQPVQDSNGHVSPVMSMNGSGLQSMVGLSALAPTTSSPAFAPSSALFSAADMPFPEIVLPELVPADDLLSNPQAAPISTERRGALRRLIDGIRRRA